ncbi:MAG TPA: hypothetical protein VIN09_03010 [Chloroflexota bacterium]
MALEQPKVELNERAGADDPIARRIVEALERIRAEEFDYDILQVAAEVLDQDARQLAANWRPSLSYFPPAKIGDEYHVTVYTSGACTTCPIKRSHVGSIEPKLREMVGYEKIFVHDYFDDE